jgi:hypothetical protein
MDVTITISLAAFLGCLIGIAGLGLYVAEHRKISRWRRRVEGVRGAEDRVAFPGLVVESQDGACC